MLQSQSFLLLENVRAAPVVVTVNIVNVRAYSISKQIPQEVLHVAECATRATAFYGMKMQ